MMFRCRPENSLPFESVDEGARKVTGYTPVELVDTGRITLPDLIRTEDRENVRATIQEAIERQRTFVVPFGILTKERSRAEGILVGHGIITPPITLHAIEGFIIRKGSEKNTQSGHTRSDPEELFGLLLSYTNDLIALLDLTGNIQFVTPPIQKLGYSPDSVKNRSIFEIISDTDQKRFQDLFNEAAIASSATGSSAQILMNHASGTISPMQVRILGQVDLGYMVLTARTIQEIRIQSEDGEVFHQIFTDNPVPMVITGATNTAIIEANEAFLHLAGEMDEALVTGLSLTSAGVELPADDMNRMITELDRTGQTGPNRIQAEISGIIQEIGVSGKYLQVHEQPAILWSFTEILSGAVDERQTRDDLVHGLEGIRRNVRSSLQTLDWIYKEKTHSHPEPIDGRVFRIFLQTVSIFQQKSTIQDSVQASVSLPIYLNALYDLIKEDFESELTGIETELLCSIEDKISEKIAVPVGIILSELMINAIIHAFSGEEKARINISLRNEEDWFILQVQDNGKGFSEEVIQGIRSKTGLEMVEKLAMDISGTVSISNDGGALVRVLFPGYL